MIGTEHSLAMDGLVEALTIYWDGFPAIEKDSIILVDLSHGNIEYLLYSLLIAKNVQMEKPSRLVGYFLETSVVTRSCPNLDYEANARLASAFGVSEILTFRKDEVRDHFGAALSQVAPIVTEFLSSGRAAFDWRAPWETAHRDFIAGTYESMLRGELLPTGDAMSPELLNSLLEMNRVHRLFEDVFASQTVEAVVTGHLDYNPWRPVSHFAARNSIPIYYFFIGRTLSVWKLHPREGENFGAARARVTASAFEESPPISDADWSYRHADVISAIAAVSATPYAVTRPDGRTLARRWLKALTPWQDDKPIVVIFTHTFSDIPCSDRQIFRDHAEWLSETLRFAAGDTTRNWIVRAHPHDRVYDRTGLLDELETRYEAFGNIQFSRGGYPMTTALSLADAVVTVRGSVGIEAVAAGIPCILAGSAPYSRAGFSRVHDSADSYFAALGASSFDPVADEEKGLARRYIRYEAVYGDIQSEALPPVTSSWLGEPQYFHAAAQRMRRYSIDRDPFAQAISSLVAVREGRASWPIRRNRSIRRTPVGGLPGDGVFYYGLGRAGQKTMLYGFYDSEPAGVWSSQIRSAVLLPVAKRNVDRLRIAGRKLYAGQTVFLRLGDGTLQPIEFDHDDFRTIEVELAGNLDGEGDMSLLEFQVSPLASPASLAMNGDTRELGFCLLAIGIVHAE